jgi:hypothetical protein
MQRDYFINVRLGKDLDCRQYIIEPKFLNIHLQLLRRIYHMRDDVDIVDDNPNAIELLQHTVPQQHARPSSLYRSMVQEQYLALLQIIGLLVKCKYNTKLNIVDMKANKIVPVTDHDIDVFRDNQGFQILHDSVALSTALCWIAKPNDATDPKSAGVVLYYDTEFERLVSDISIWLLRECLLCQSVENDGVKVSECTRMMAKLCSCKLTNTLPEQWLIKLLKYVLTSVTSSKPNPSLVLDMPEEGNIVRPFHFEYEWFHVKICQLLSSAFRQNDTIKKHFGELGGTEVLLGVLSVSDLNN